MKVISKGKKYRAECSNCGCIFEYTKKDIDEYACITCPSCGEIEPHTKENEIE